MCTISKCADLHVWCIFTLMRVIMFASTVFFSISITWFLLFFLRSCLKCATSFSFLASITWYLSITTFLWHQTCITLLTWQLLFLQLITRITFCFSRLWFFLLITFLFWRLILKIDNTFILLNSLLFIICSILCQIINWCYWDDVWRWKLWKFNEVQFL